MRTVGSRSGSSSGTTVTRKAAPGKCVSASGISAQAAGQTRPRSAPRTTRRRARRSGTGRHSDGLHVLSALLACLRAVIAVGPGSRGYAADHSARPQSLTRAARTVVAGQSLAARSAPTSRHPRSTAESSYTPNGPISSQVTPHQHRSARSCCELLVELWIPFLKSSSGNRISARSRCGSYVGYSQTRPVVWASFVGGITCERQHCGTYSLQSRLWL